MNATTTDTADADDTPELDRLLEHIITPLRRDIASESAYQIILTARMLGREINSESDTTEMASIIRGVLVRFAALAEVVDECLGYGDHLPDRQLLEIVGLPADLASDVEVAP